MTQEINQYLKKSYQRLLDYSIFHASRAGIPDEATDVLNEVILALLQMDDTRVMNLLSSKKIEKGIERSELDWFIMKMIKLNCYSETAPYRAKLKQIHTSNIDVCRLQIEDVDDCAIDRAEVVLMRFKQVREAFDDLCLSQKGKQIFEYKFFEGQLFSEWKGKETKKELYEVYTKVTNLIKARIEKKTLI